MNDEIEMLAVKICNDNDGLEWNWLIKNTYFSNKLIVQSQHTRLAITGNST